MATTTTKKSVKAITTVEATPMIVTAPIKKVAVRPQILVASAGEVALPKAGVFYGYARTNSDTEELTFNPSTVEGMLNFMVTLFDGVNPENYGVHRSCGLTVDAATAEALQKATAELIDTRREASINDSYVVFEFTAIGASLIKGTTLSWASGLTGVTVRKDIIAPSRIADSAEAIAEASAVQWENREAARQMRQMANPVEVKPTASDKLKALMATLTTGAVIAPQPE
jgi:hypothetical protein